MLTLRVAVVTPVMLTGAVNIQTVADSSASSCYGSSNKTGSIDGSHVVIMVVVFIISLTVVLMLVLAVVVVVVVAIAALLADVL